MGLKDVLFIAILLGGSEMEMEMEMEIGKDVGWMVDGWVSDDW